MLTSDTLTQLSIGTSRAQGLSALGTTPLTTDPAETVTGDLHTLTQTDETHTQLKH